MSAEQQRNLFQAISKRLTELMGGDIRVTSQTSVGSTFSFTIKLRPGRQPAAAVHAAAHRALVVDDSPLARTILIRLLEEQGCSAIAAESGQAALALLADTRTAPFEFVTIDLNMPGMDGLELAEAIVDQVSPQPKLVMVTAVDTTNLAEKERLRCFDAVLSKPVTAAQIGKLLATEALNSPSSPIQPAPLAGLRVLLVDDLPTNCLIAGEILEAFGATVETAGNGVQALHKLLDDQVPCDVVLMDIQMPEMDGLEATRRLRATLRGARLPIIAMTAHALESERERCRAAGMDDFIAKPIDPDLLQQKLLRWRPAPGGQAARRTAAHTAMPSGGDLPELPGIDKAEGLRRMMNKPTLYEKVLRDFHSRFLSEPETIRAAIDSGDLATAERRAHSTKGLAGTIGASALQQAAKALETALRERDAALETLFTRFADELRQVTDGIARGFDIERSRPG